MGAAQGSRRVARILVPPLVCAALVATGCGTTLREVQGWSRDCDQSALRDGLDAERSWIRREAALGAGVCGVAAARPRLEALLSDPDEPRWVRAAAARALGRLGRDASFPVLRGLAADPGLEPEIQVELVGALERFAREMPAACDALAPLAERDEPLVAARAEVAVSASGCALRRGGAG